MKVLLQDNGGYKLYAYAKKMDDKYALTHVVFSSTFDGAKNPNEERKISEMFLSEEAVDKLKALL